MTAASVATTGKDRLQSAATSAPASRNEDDLLPGCCGTDCFAHGNDRGLRSAVIGNMVGGDFEVLGGDEEKDVLMLPQDPDIRFIARRDLIDRAFMLEVECVAVERSGCRVV